MACDILLVGFIECKVPTFLPCCSHLKAPLFCFKGSADVQEQHKVVCREAGIGGNCQPLLSKQKYCSFGGTVQLDTCQRILLHEGDGEIRKEGLVARF